MQGHDISRRKEWWVTGNPVSTKTKDHLDLWARRPKDCASQTLRSAFNHREEDEVTSQLAWHTIHDDPRLEDYFGAGQGAHLRGATGTVLCTDGSVKLQVLENGHTKASLGAGVAYRDGDGTDQGFGLEGRADAYEAESGAANIVMTVHADDDLHWGCDSKALLQGLAAWQNDLFRPSPHDHHLRLALKTLVETAAAQTAPTHAYWFKAHAGMELN
eukprot:2435146-Rhodomonas_salina.1